MKNLRPRKEKWFSCHLRALEHVSDKKPFQWDSLFLSVWMYYKWEERWDSLTSSQALYVHQSKTHARMITFYQHVKIKASRISCYGSVVANPTKLKNIRNCFGKFQGANILWSKILNMSLSLAFDTDFVMMTWKICWNGYRFKTTISVSSGNNCSRGFFVVFLLLLSLFFVVFFFPA